ncbi:histidine kinase [Malaciobacter halophilus]|uniref:histidine kinase n=1 Tax=Malaciobacter halophilus TaxID=197482 RepID=A0A2N1J2A2_9BACT|nr:cache domain-containing protein [Malaciobacter halophilus]AXH09338.1 Cache sensor-containing two-component system histidine kinase [Malaciobacter halophilus]PKI80671.1 histidine kinase [Malaciobacter halophilus]
MFSEKNISKLIVLTPIITVLLIAFFTIYFFIQNQYKYFESESIREEANYILKQKNILKKEINSVISYLDYHEKKAKQEVENRVKNRVEILYNQLSILTKDKNITNTKKSELMNQLIDSKAIERSDYFFAYDVQNDSFIQPFNRNVQKEFEVDDKFIKNYLYPDTGKFIELKDRLVYIKYIPKLDWIIGTVENSQENIKKIKKDLIKYIETIRYENNGYIWIHDTTYHLIAHPFRQESIGKYDIDLKDASGDYITKKFIDETKKKPNGVFVEYNWQKPNHKKFSKKLGYFKLYKKWNWVVGAGLYMDDIENSILKNKKLLEKRVDKYIETVVVISFFVIFIIGILSVFISNRINQAFNEYRKSVIKKEQELQDLNKNLELKVEKAISDVKKKDRAMLHQSRLARMGAMLSMIAHQWRQPLSELSGVLMELETANKFKKVDEKMIQDSVNESNKLIEFMSNTIEDFRNFFKPDKKKVYFYLDDACNEALTLVDASIKNFNINLVKKVKCNSIIYGYEREFAQVMLNLISNAKDILVQRDIKNPNIYIEVDAIGSNAIVKVLDNAGGVEDEYIDLIFEPYFTTKSSSKGTGLGLYMAKMIVEKNMEGEISVENTNKGALFLVTLPFKSGQE